VTGTETRFNTVYFKSQHSLDNLIYRYSVADREILLAFAQVTSAERGVTRLTGASQRLRTRLRR
jgi:hypothetical protein